jgi:molybdopterin converting factor subunit 1
MMPLLLFPNNQKMNSTIRISILYFATVKDATGIRMESIDLSNDTSIREMLSKISIIYPKLKHILNNIQISVNYRIVDLNTVLKEGDEVALLPPISGG